MEHLGTSWKHLGGNLGFLEPLGGLLGASWGHILVPSGASWERLGGLLRPSWGHLEASGRLLGGLLEAFGASWGLIGRILEHFGGFLGSALELKGAHVGLCWPCWSFLWLS